MDMILVTNIPIYNIYRRHSNIVFNLALIRLTQSCVKILLNKFYDVPLAEGVYDGLGEAKAARGPVDIVLVQRYVTIHKLLNVSLNQTNQILTCNVRDYLQAIRLCFQQGLQVVLLKRGRRQVVLASLLSFDSARLAPVVQINVRDGFQLQK